MPVRSSWGEFDRRNELTMDFQEYLNSQARMFVQYYRCLSTSLLNKDNLDEDGYWVIMPPSALDRLNRFDLPSPMLFQIQNPSTERFTHCGVLEFVAEEGFIHMPSRLMARLGVQENEIVLVRSTSLPTATFVKLQPHTMDFLDVSHHKELLEYNFRKFQCMTAGETIVVTEGERRYYLDLLEARPADAVCVLNTDCDVDFAPPLDYVEPPPAPAPAPVASQGNGEPQQPPWFSGVAARMDGKPVEQPPLAPVPVGRQGDHPRQQAQFTGVAMRMDGKPVELPPPTPSPAAPIAGALGAPKRKLRLGAPSAAGSCVSKAKEEGAGKEQEKRFVGTQYSLKD